MTKDKLIKIRDIKTDLHCHSVEGSPHDARFTVEQLAGFYTSVVGLDYVVLTNHCWKRDPSWLSKTALAVKEAERRFPDLDILNGQELNIDGEGGVFLPEDIEISDFNIASIHQRPFPPDVNVTQRLLTALENPYVDVIGHPGIGYSDFLYGIDWKELAQKAKKLKKAIEINISELLEFIDNPTFTGKSTDNIYILQEHIISTLAESEVLISLGSDLHTHGRVETLQPIGMKWRRFLEIINYLRSSRINKSQILNTLSAQELRDWAKSHRKRLHES